MLARFHYKIVQMGSLSRVSLPHRKHLLSLKTWRSQMGEGGTDGFHQQNLQYIVLISSATRDARLYQRTLYTTKVVRSNPVHGEVYSIQHYVIKFVSYKRQVGGFLRFLHQ